MRRFRWLAALVALIAVPAAAQASQVFTLTLVVGDPSVDPGALQR